MEKFIEQEVKGEQIQFDKDLRPYIAERPMGVIVECLQSKARNPKTRNLTLLEALTHCIKGAARLKENSYYAYYLSIRHIPLGHVHITKQSITIDFDGIGITPLKFIYENTMGAYIGNQDTQEILSEATTDFNGYVLRELLRTCKFLKVPQLTPPPTLPTANAKKKSAIKETPNTNSTLQTRYEQRLQEFYYQTGVIFDRNGTSFKQTFIMMDILLPMLIAMRDFAGFKDLRGLKTIYLIPLSTHQHISYNGGLIAGSHRDYEMELVSKPFGQPNSETYRKRQLQVMTTFAHEFGHYIELRCVGSNEERRKRFYDVITAHFPDKGLQGYINRRSNGFPTLESYWTFMNAPDTKETKGIKYYVSCREIFARIYSQVILENYKLPVDNAFYEREHALTDTRIIREYLEELRHTSTYAKK